MNLRGTVGVAALAAALVTIGGGMARADTTSGDAGVLSGNQITIPIQAPISIVGNAVGVLGHATAGSTRTIVVPKAPPTHPRHHPGHTLRHRPRHHRRHHPRRGGHRSRSWGYGGILAGDRAGAPGRACGMPAATAGGCGVTVAVHTGGPGGRPAHKGHHGRRHRGDRHHGDRDGRHHRGAHHRWRHRHHGGVKGQSTTAWSMAIA